MKRALVGLFSLAVALSAHADITVPDETEFGSTTAPHREFARTYGEFISAAQFGAIGQPVMFTGMQIRLSTSPSGGLNWPTSNILFSQYDIQLSSASAAMSLSGGDWNVASTFAGAQGSNLTTVRSGALSIPAGAYVYDGGLTPDEPNSFSFSLTFSTPYLYTPGEDLVLLIRHSGYGNTEPAAPFAAQNSVLGRITGAFSTAGSNAVSPTNFNIVPLIINFQGAFVPEPGMISLVVTGLALVGLAHRRRLRSAADRK